MKIDVMIALVFGFILLSTRNAHAYLDPGTGSMIVQGVIAALGAAVLGVRMYWHRIRRFVSGNPSRGREDRGEAVE